MVVIKSTIILGYILLIVQEVYLSDQNGFIGCFKDKIGQIFNGEIVDKIFEKEEPVSTCINFCRDSTTKYAGVKRRKDSMHCFCGNGTKVNSEEGQCITPCPGSGIAECPGAKEITLYDTFSACLSDSCQDSDKCNGSNDCTEDEKEKTTSSAAVPVVVTIMFVAMVCAIILISMKRRRHIRDKKQQHSDNRHIPVTENNMYTFSKTTPPNTCSSNYSTIPDPYNYVDVDTEGSLDNIDNTITCDNYSKLMPNGQYDCTNFKPSQCALSNSNYNHINIDAFGASSENCYSSTEQSHELARTRNDDTYNKLTEVVQIPATSECSDDPEYNHTRANPFCTKVNLSERLEVDFTSI